MQKLPSIIVSLTYNFFVVMVCEKTLSKLIRTVSTSSVVNKIIPTGGKGHSSHQWLSRQINDPYVEKAKLENYRCRSAFKLLEINAQYNLLKPGQCVVDCGAAPGSWTQVAVLKTNSDRKDSIQPVGKVIAIDRSPIYPVEGAHVLGNLDFTTDVAQSKLKEIISDNCVDVVLSDMAPNATGIKSADHDLIIELAYSAVRFALQVSAVGASILIKVWDGNLTQTLQKDLETFYNSVVYVKPKASRSNSAENFLLARNFKGLKT